MGPSSIARIRVLGWWRLALASAALMIASGCGSSSSSSTAPSSTAPSLTISAAQSFISAGQQVQMTARLATNSANITTSANWLSSDPSVMTVSSTGLATALAGGSVIISATYQGGSASVSLTIFPTEVCLSYVTPNLAVTQDTNFWTLGDGAQAIFSLDTATDAANALAVAQRYSSLCYIGRNNVRANRLAYIANFWAGATNDATTVTPEDCTPYAAASLQVSNLGSTGWAVMSGAQQLLLLDTQADANIALAEARKYSAQCFIGRQNTRPNPLEFIVQYWK